MARVADIINNPRLFANLYAKELPDNTVYNDDNAPYIRSTQITPDVVEKLNTTIYDLPEQLSLRRINRVSFSTYNGERRSQSGQTQLPPWREYLPHFIGQLCEVTVSLNRSDLPKASGVGAMNETHRLTTELTKDAANFSYLGELPDQLGYILNNRPPDQPLAIGVRGNVSRLTVPELRNVFGNLRSLVESV